jgi:hypothetical protein
MRSLAASVGAGVGVVVLLGAIVLVGKVILVSVGAGAVVVSVSVFWIVVVSIGGNAGVAVAGEQATRKMLANTNNSQVDLFVSFGMVYSPEFSELLRI